MYIYISPLSHFRHPSLGQTFLVNSPRHRCVWPRWLPPRRPKSTWDPSPTPLRPGKTWRSRGGYPWGYIYITYRHTYIYIIYYVIIYCIYLNIVWTIVYGGCSTTYEANHHDVIPVYLFVKPPAPPSHSHTLIV